MSPKKFLFIDGTNLYAAQYELFGPNKYLYFPDFIKNLEKKLKAQFDAIYFYASYSPQSHKLNKKEKQYLKNEALFYCSVKKTKKIFFFKGYRSKASGKEKEVDVKLAVDIVDFAHRNKYQAIYLFSGDADFLQALFSIKSLNKEIFVICLDNQVLHRAAFHFETYILKTKKKNLVKFKKFQRYSFINLNFKNFIKEV